MLRIVEVGVLLVAVFLIAPVRADDDALEKFWSDAPQAWKRIEDAYQGKQLKFTEEFTESITKPFRGEIARVRRASVANYFGRWLRVDTMMESSDIDQNAFLASRDEVESKRIILSSKRVESKNASSMISNDVYAAFVTLADTPAVDTVLPPSSPERRKYVNKKIRRCLPGLGLGINQVINNSIEGVDGFAPSDFPGGYRVVSAEFVDGIETGLVSLQLAVSSLSADEIAKAADASIEVVLDPQRSWSVVSFKQLFDFKATASKLGIEMTVEYPEGDTSSFHPRSIHEIAFNRSPESDTERDSNIVVGELLDSNFGRNDCYLSAFGLPEPDFSKQSSLFGVLSVVSIILIVALLVLRRRLIRSS